MQAVQPVTLMLHKLCKGSSKKSILFGERSQMWVGGVGWSQTFNQNYFYGLFFLSFLFVDKFTEIEGVLTTESQIWGGLAGSQVWDFFPNKPFFTTSLMEMKEENYIDIRQP